jgi:DNA polymerase
MAYHPAMIQSNAQSAIAALRWLVEAGADEAIGEAPVNRLKPAAVATPARAVTPLPSAKPVPKPAPVAVANDPIGRATELAAAATTLAELKAALESFDGCALKVHATNTVFSDGTPSHRILVIGESPGREEDLAGLPFVGRAGKLLDRMLAAIGLDRKSNVYITNVLNWRPPNNRDPSPEEAAACLPFLRRHIELVAPGVMVLFGAVAVRHVMGKHEGIMRLRGTWMEYYACGRMVPVMPTLHPAYLLRRPQEKRLAWRDLQAIGQKIETLGLLERIAAPG